MKLLVNKIKYITRQFTHQLGYVPNINNPKTFNEKLQWLKIYYRNPLLTICADKYAVREYIKNKIGEKYLIPLIGVYENENQIDFDKLPNKFILKINNSSGKNIICTDKTKLDIKEIKNKLHQWLLPKSNHYYYSYEWSYKNIKSKIVCEKLLETKKYLMDYEFYCFNGIPKFIVVVSEKNTSPKVDYYDLNWKLLPFKKKTPNSLLGIEKPHSFSKMLEIAKILSKGFPFVRVDLYEVNKKIYNGELTFYPNAGMGKFHPISSDYEIGKMLKLPKSPNILIKLIRQFT